MTPTPFGRLQSTDPAVNRIIQDLYDKLAQVQSALALPVIKATTTTPTIQDDAKGWTLLANSDLQNGWTNKLGVDYQSSYRRVGNWAVLRGTLTGGTITEATVIFAVPVELRPKLRLTTTVLGSTGAAGFVAGLVVNANGKVTISNVSNNTTLHLDCVYYLGD